MRKLLFVLAATLTGCANQATYTKTIADLQVAVPAFEAALATYPQTQTPAVLKAETDLNTALAALAAQPAPATAQAVLNTFQAVAAALPSNVLSPAHQAELAADLALIKVILADTSA